MSNRKPQPSHLRERATYAVRVDQLRPGDEVFDLEHGMNGRITHIEDTGAGWTIDLISAETGERVACGPFRASGELVRLDSNS